MKSKLLIYMVTTAVLVFGSLAQATTINYTPANAVWTSIINSQLSETQVADIVGTTSTLEIYYKAEVGGTDSGTFADDYTTVFSNTATVPEDALISWIDGSDIITCPECYLVVKDGSQDPAQYFFNLGSWNGTDSLNLTDFWPTNGAISNVAIYGEIDSSGGGDQGIPEPNIIALLGMGLLGIGLSNLRRKRKTS